MYGERTVGVVVPAYNEEGFVADVIATVPHFVDRVYVIDDGSTDGTWSKILAQAERSNVAAAETEHESGLPADGGANRFDRRVVPVRHEQNRGVGGAIKTGYLRALHDDIDVTVVVGGDGQMDPERMESLVAPVAEGHADYTKGNRLISREFHRGMSGWRLFGNSLLTFLTKISSGYWKTMDPQNGYTAISKRALERIGIEDMYEFYGYCNDLLVRLNVRKMRVADVAMPAVYGEEMSHISYRSYIPRVSMMLLRDFFWRLRAKYLILDFHPLALFYLFGTAFSILALLGGGWTIYAKLVKNEPMFVPASVSILILMLGSLFVLFAMLFDMEVNQDLEIRMDEGS